MGETRYTHETTNLARSPARPLADGALAAIGRDDWWLVAVRGAPALIAIDDLVPQAPPSPRCLGRAPGEQHTVVALDRGARVLVDEQELPADLDQAPREGYRRSTVAELPARQVRPSVSRESGACLVWEAELRAPRRVGHEIARGVELHDDGAGGLLARDLRLRADGTREELALPGAGFSADASHAVAFDHELGGVQVVELSTGAVRRRWRVDDPDTPLTGALAWAAADVAVVPLDDREHLIPVDDRLPVRIAEEGLETDPRSRVGTILRDGELIVITVADGAVLARHPGTWSRAAVVPDDSGRVVAEEIGGAVVLLAPSRAPLALEGVSGLSSVELADGGVLVVHGYDTTAVDPATGRVLAAVGSAALLAGDRLWSIEHGRLPQLVETPVDGRPPRRRDLDIAGLPLVAVVTVASVSPDRRRVTARYRVTEELYAQAIWDIESGALLWVGPPSAQVIGDWIVSGQRVYQPAFELDAVLHQTGARTNLRVCRDSLRAVPVWPPPAPETIWAPDPACLTPE
jgi:hypothetical protein